MAGITVQSGPVVAKLKKLSQQLRNEVELLLMKEGAKAQRRMVERVSGTSKRGNGLRVRSGLLRATLGFRTDVKDGRVQLELGTVRIGGAAAVALNYAATHEYGATITKGPGFLTIPLPAALTPSGVARFSARDTMFPGRVPGLTSTFFLGDFRRKVLMGIFGGPKAKKRRPTVKKKGGVNVKRHNIPHGAVKKKAVPGKSKSVGTKPVPLFVLVHKVVIPKRPFVAPERKLAVEAIRKALPGILTKTLG